MTPEEIMTAAYFAVKAAYHPPQDPVGAWSQVIFGGLVLVLGILRFFWGV